MIKVHPTLNIPVSDDGRILVKEVGRSIKRRWSTGSDCHGYRIIMVDGKNYSVHRLVAETFIGECPLGYEVDHIDRDKTNNSAKNLRYVSSKENRLNRADVDRVIEAIGCHQREDKPAYNKFYASTANGIIARQKAREKYGMTHRSVRFSDGHAHFVDADKAESILKLPVQQRIWGEVYG